jgi:twitching motility protein PilT
MTTGRNNGSIKDSVEQIKTFTAALRARPQARSIELPLSDGNRRFRVHVKHMRGGVGIDLRLLADKPMMVEQLETPEALVQLTLRRIPGLILVTGESGAGKSTTLAALVALILKKLPIKVVTYESPIEVVFENGEYSLVQQHEVGTHDTADITNYTEAAISAMREDPDVVMFGELRAAEEIRLAVEVAETGHLVFATLHTGTAVESVSRLISAGLTESRGFFSHKVASTLLAVLSQRLIKPAGMKMRANYELMVVNEAISSCISSGDFGQLDNAILTNRDAGSFHFDDHIVHLVTDGNLTVEEALSVVPQPQKTYAKMNRIPNINIPNHIRAQYNAK